MAAVLAFALALGSPAGHATADAACDSAKDVCACSALGVHCGWCSSSSSCRKAPVCTTTCRECPYATGAATSPSCPACAATCIDTCPAARSVCACAELSGCGWCNTTQRCAVYPECTTTCEECSGECGGPSCAKHCLVHFHPHTRKKTLWPLGREDVATTVAIFLAVVMASAAGIGGGAVLVPLFTMLGGFTEHEAIPLSIATIFGGSAFSVFFNFGSMPHPLSPRRHCIAYDAAVILLPMTLAGVTVGVYLNKVCPNWLIMLLLVALCGYTGRRTLHTGLKAYDRESAAREEAKAARREADAEARAARGSGSDAPNPHLARARSEGEESAADSESTPVLAAQHRRAAAAEAAGGAVKRSTSLAPGVARVGGGAPGIGGPAGGGGGSGAGADGVELIGPGGAGAGGAGAGGAGAGGGPGADLGPEEAAMAAELERLQQHEGKTPWNYLYLISRVWLVVVLHALLKGGHGMPSVLGLVCGSAAYWLVVLSGLPLLLLLSKWGGALVCDEHRKRMALGYEYCEGDVVWNETRVRHACGVVGVAAIMAGLLGVGGGMVLGPIFLELQMNPQVASATSTLMVLLMSSCTIAQFLIFGMLDSSFASWYCFVGVCGAVVGTKGAKALVTKLGRTSVLVFILAALLLGSGLLMVVTGSMQLARTGLTGFRPLCGRAGAAAKDD